MLKRFVIGYYRSDSAILNAVRRLREDGVAIYDTFTPYAVHGLDTAMGLRRSRLSLVTFIAGAIGCAFAIYFQYWTSSVDWPINVGGKPGNSWPAWVPIAFEITVLLAGLSTVAAFFIRDRLRWGKKPHFLPDNVTDDAFALVVEEADGTLDLPAVKQKLSELGAYQVEERVELP